MVLVYKVTDSEGLDVSIEMSKKCMERCTELNLSQRVVVGCLMTLIDTIIEGNIPNEFAVIDVVTYCTIAGSIEMSQEGKHIIVKTIIGGDSTFYRRGNTVMTVDSVEGLMLGGRYNANNADSAD